MSRLTLREIEYLDMIKKHDMVIYGHVLKRLRDDRLAFKENLLAQGRNVWGPGTGTSTGGGDFFFEKNYRGQRVFQTKKGVKILKFSQRYPGRNFDRSHIVCWSIQTVWCFQGGKFIYQYPKLSKRSEIKNKLSLRINGNQNLKFRNIEVVCRTK